MGRTRIQIDMDKESLKTIDDAVDHVGGTRNRFLIAGGRFLADHVNRSPDYKLIYVNKNNPDDVIEVFVVGYS